MCKVVHNISLPVDEDYMKIRKLLVGGYDLLIFLLNRALDNTYRFPSFFNAVVGYTIIFDEYSWSNLISFVVAVRCDLVRCGCSLCPFNRWYDGDWRRLYPYWNVHARLLMPMPMILFIYTDVVAAATLSAIAISTIMIDKGIELAASSFGLAWPHGGWMGEVVAIAIASVLQKALAAAVKSEKT